MPDPIDRLNGALTDPYRIERELGQGGTATVYLAPDEGDVRRGLVVVTNRCTRLRERMAEGGT